MAGKRRRFTPEFKARVALEALREHDSVQAIARRHELHPNQVSTWKRQLLEGLPEVFAGGAGRKLAKEHEAKVRELHAKIGELTVERDFFRRGPQALSRAERGRMIERDGPLSLSRQCALVGVSRSSLYYRPRGESAENLALMRRIDELHMAYPFYGSRQLVRHLRREGATAGRHRIRRLMRLMGVEATYRRPRTSVAGPEHRVFPYLLRGLTISRADHVWCADITHVPVTQGFFYLVAVMDWATRHVLAWRLSNTMDASFRVEALDDALGWRAPEILNTDQGAQFTSEAFADRVLAAGAAFSMDGRGRFLDNIFIERLWRSLKYEAVYLHELRDGLDAERIIGSWFDFYNEVRPHSSLGGRTPGDAYRNGTGAV
ncbi:IS3 family transposase [Candidatus Palauibacter sp.]|uniref:IS3 family transposase n=1 Tax=Candidatus Palauibacter sp. TaxID=3101350 RepID=UPI003B5BA81D